MAGPFAQEFFEKAARPTPVIDVRAGSDQGQGPGVLRKPGGVAAEFDGVLLRGEFSTAAPGFIANAPVAHVVGVGRTGFGALFREGGAARGRVAIFDPAIEFRGRKAAYIGGEVRLGSDEFAEMDELVGAEFVGVVFVTGGR